MVCAVFLVDAGWERAAAGGTTKICGGHKNLWWPQKFVVASRQKEFSVRKRKQVLSCGEPYFLNGR